MKLAVIIYKLDTPIDFYQIYFLKTFHLNYEGEGPNARVEVNFGPNKTKWLMVSYAKLTPL